MGYANTKTYTLDAASTAFSDIIAALITHFTSAPGLWQLTPSVTPVAGEALAIRAKTAPTCDLAIRRVSTSTALAITVDPGMTISDVGDATTAPTGSASASPECQSGAMSSYSARVFVCEYDDAVLILFQDTTKAFTPYGLHAGRVYDAARDGDLALGLDGHGALVGHINTTGSQCWSSNSTQTNGSSVRVFDSAGAADWRQAEFDDLAISTSSSLASTSNDGQLRSPRPLLLKGSNVNGTNDLMVGFARWLAAAPIGATPSFNNSAPRNLIGSSTDEAWIYLKNTAGITGLIASWERSVSPT
jgi:hypothetical protein